MYNFTCVNRKTNSIFIVRFINKDIALKFFRIIKSRQFINRISLIGMTFPKRFNVFEEFYV